MSTSTEVVYVRGTSARRLRRALVDMMLERGLALHASRPQRNPFADASPPRPPAARELCVLRKGPWFAIASDALGELDHWGARLSKSLGRSVLGVMTWDGEAALVASRWRGGDLRSRLELLEEAYRDARGRVRAPAKVLRPWLDRASRAAILRRGILLSDEDDEDEDPEDDIFISEEVSRAALLDLIGAPQEHPYYAAGATRLTFLPKR